MHKLGKTRVRLRKTNYKIGKTLKVELTIFVYEEKKPKKSFFFFTKTVFLAEDFDLVFCCKMFACLGWYLANGQGSVCVFWSINI